MPDKNALLDWFASDLQMRGWDVIVALKRDDLNRLIEQAFVERFNETSFGKPFSARLDYEQAERYLQNFVLGPPRLDFDDTGLNDSRANLGMAVVGGSDVVLQHGVQWEVSRVEWIQPLQGPVLRMMLNLHQAPGSIEAGGVLSLDLKDTNHFILDFRGEPNVQRLGGEAFEYLFAKIPDAEKIFKLGKFVTDDTQFYRLEKFWLRTQANKESGRSGEGAVLVFMSRDKDFEGTPPGENHDFRFLIPNDLPDCSATVLFTNEYMLSPLMIESLLNILDRHDQPTHDGAVWRIPNALKLLYLPESEAAEGLKDFDWRGLYRANKGESEIIYGMIVSRGSGLTFEFFPDTQECQIVWQASAITRPPLFLIMPFELTSRFKVSSADGKLNIELVDHDAKFWQSGLFDWEESLIEYIRGLIYGLAMLIVIFVDKELTKNLSRTGGAEAIRRVVQLYFDNAIVAGEAHHRHEVITFNEIAKVKGIPDVQPRWPNVAVGEQLQFNVANASAPIDWRVEALSGDQKPVGSIDGNGYYKVPANAQLSGFVRERICATQGDVTGYSMVTIAHDALSIAPLVQVLSARGSMVLDAGSTALSPTFQWKIDGKPVAGNPTGSQILFTAGEPDRGYPTFTRVQVAVGGVQREACVITLAKQSQNTLKVRIDEMDTANGTVALRLAVPVQPGKEVTWRVEYGGGEVDAFTEDKTKALFIDDKAQRVAVVHVSVATPGSEPSGVGFIVLPLPLYEYPAIYTKLMLPE